MAESLLKPSDVRQLLNVGLSTVYRLAAKGVLPTVKIPGAGLVRFKAERVEALLRQWEQNGRRRRRADGQRQFHEPEGTIGSKDHGPCTKPSPSLTR